MRNFTISLSFFLCLYLSAAFAQEDTKSIQTFEQRARSIAHKIDAITKEEKEALKVEVEAVNEQQQKGEITSAEANERKLQLAETRAGNIETRVTAAEEELNQLVKDHVDGKIQTEDSTSRIRIVFKNKKYREGRDAGESRTTSQFVFATGLNNLETNMSIAHSDYKVWGSHFYEWGITWNTRIMKNHNLLHAKYGLSLQYNNLRATENRFLAEDGDETVLVESGVNLEDSRFRNVNIVVPVHLEFDFTKKKIVDDRVVFRSHKGFRLGVGGFAGANIKSKQILKFEDENGNDVKQRTRGDFNVNDFVYGVSAYVGYGATSLYMKYDLNPIFTDNAIDQRNVSMGIRFDLN